MLKLDFTLETSDERAAYVNQHMDTIGTFYTKKELDTIANYILYGKDEDGTSIVDRKEVQIKAKHNTYARKEPESLEALMEMPTFDERIFAGKTKYRTPKPTINRTTDADVPGMKELWEQIDEIQHLIDANNGKIEDPNARKLTSRELYDYSHLLVELRRQQFSLKDAVKPVIGRSKTGITPSYYHVDEHYLWDVKGSGYAIAPMGLYPAKKARFDDPRSVEEVDYEYDTAATYILDFRNPDHIYQLLENYDNLLTDALEDEDGTVEGILQTLDWYVEKADLSDVQREIIRLKKLHCSNEYIHDELFKKFRVSHSNNYISTIYKQQSCDKIAAAATLAYDYYMEREHLSSWKKCACCGKWKLKDTREYARKSRSADGLSTICKSCDRDKRVLRKEGKK